MSESLLPNSLPSKIWYCKIGEVPEEVLHREWPTGADSPMRDAVSEAFRQITGEPPMFIFSGWAAELTEYERAVVENREPDPEVIRADLQRELAILPSAEQSKDSPPKSSLPFDGRLRGERREHPTSYVKCGECGAAKFNPIHDREQPYFFRHEFAEPRGIKQAQGPVTAKEAEAGAYYEEESYVRLAPLSSLIIQWRARAKRLLEQQPYPGFAGEAEQLDRLASELEHTVNG